MQNGRIKAEKEKPPEINSRGFSICAYAEKCLWFYIESIGCFAILPNGYFIPHFA